MSEIAEHTRRTHTGRVVTIAAHTRLPRGEQDPGKQYQGINDPGIIVNRFQTFLGQPLTDEFEGFFAPKFIDELINFREGEQIYDFYISENSVPLSFFEERLNNLDKAFEVARSIQVLGIGVLDYATDDEVLIFTQNSTLDEFDEYLKGSKAKKRRLVKKVNSEKE